jgi:hypothetical protein
MQTLDEGDDASTKPARSCSPLTQQTHTAFGGRTGIRRGDTGTADGETTMTVAGRGYAPFVRSF